MKIVPSPDDPLEQFLADACEDLEARVGRAGRVRDFHDVMLRAHRLDPAITPIAAVRDAARYAQVIAMPRVATARRTAPTREPALRRVAWLGLAAAVLIGLGLGAALEARQARREATDTVQLFVDGRAEPGQTSEAEHRAPPPPRVRPIAAPIVEAPPTPTAPAPIDPEPPAPAAAQEAEYLEMDRAADAAWRRGDLPRARALFTALTRSAAAPRVVEAAYGDLAVLLRQDGAHTALERLWRRYLVRFPRGRFAADARAELCRGADDPPACWTRYLHSFPAGAHADEARARIASDDPVMPSSSQGTHIQPPLRRAEESE